MRFLYLLLGIVLISAITFLSLGYWQVRYPLFLGFYDIAHHTSAAVGFNQTGGFTLTNFWAGTNVSGTAYIYFPFIHIIELLLLSLGASSFFLTYWLSWLFLPLSFISIFLFSYKAFGVKTSLYALLLLSLSPVWMEKQWGLPAQALVYTLTPLIFLALVKERYILVSVLTLSCMATHFTGILLLPFLLVYGLQNKNQRRNILIISGIILLAGSPFIWFALNRLRSSVLFIAWHKSTLIASVRHSLYQLFDIKHQFHVYLGWLAVIGLIICYFKKGKFLILPSYFFVFLPLAWTTQVIRFWGAPALFIFALLGAVALGTIHEWIEKVRRRPLLGFSFFISISILAYSLFYLLSANPVQTRTPTIVYLKTPSIWLHPKPTFSMKDRWRIIELVKEKVEDEEFFWIDSSNNINNFVALNSRRSTISSVNLKKGGINLIKGIKLAVAKEAPSPDYIMLEKINSQFNAYILDERFRAAKVKIPKPLIRTELLKIIFFGIGLLVFLGFISPGKWAMRRQSKKEV